MIGVILAAGEGVRLRPLTLERPKPLFPVGDRTVLGGRVAALARAGAEKIWINTHHHAAQIEASAADLARQHRVEIAISNEPEALGTAGALRAMFDDLHRGPFVVTNGDVVCDVDLASLWAQHERTGSSATLLAIPQMPVADFGIDAQNTIVALKDRRVLSSPGHAYGGIGVFSPAVLEYIPEGPSGLFETVLQGLFEDGFALNALIWDGYWNDIGTPQSYLQANLDWLEDRDCFLDPTARASGSRLTRSIVAARAVVDDGSVLDECVVWPEAHVKTGTYRRVIIAPTASLQC